MYLWCGSHCEKCTMADPKKLGWDNNAEAIQRSHKGEGFSPDYFYPLLLPHSTHLIWNWEKYYYFYLEFLMSAEGLQPLWSICKTRTYIIRYCKVASSRFSVSAESVSKWTTRVSVWVTEWSSLWPQTINQLTIATMYKYTIAQLPECTDETLNQTTNNMYNQLINYQPTDN